MMKTLFSFWRKSKERQIVNCALKLEKLLNEIGREPAKNGEASCIRIYEFSHQDLHHLDCNGLKSIKFNKKGDLVE